MNHDNPFIKTDASPMIIDIGDNDYVTLYDYGLEDSHIILDYRYTGNKSKEEVERVLSSVVISSFEKEFGDAND